MSQKIKKDPKLVKLGLRIKELRNKRGLTLEQMEKGAILHGDIGRRLKLVKISM